MENRPPSSSDHHPAPDPSEQNNEFDAPTLGPDSSRTARETSEATERHSPSARSDAGQPTLPPDTTGGQEFPSGNLNDRTAAKTPAVGRAFGDYELLDEIARGGMGVVYKARQKSLDRIVALKMILSGQLASKEEVQRFYSEATAAANLDHRSIVEIFEIGEQDGTHFFSMKLIEGSHLGTEMSRFRSELKAGVALIEKVCRAVHHAHQRGILHRDLKPGNILIDENGEPFVTDLGLARKIEGDSNLTRTGAVVGTPGYMPPEQASGSSDITTAVDVYSLGAIIYEMLTGRPPFTGSTPMEVLLKVINDEPDRPSMSGLVDRNLELIALKCLSKQPAERYASAQELADDLQRWLNGEPIGIRAPSFAAVARHWMRQNFGRAGWIPVIGLLGGVIAGLGLWCATVQQEMEQARSVYFEMPTPDAPFTLLPWNTPPFLTLPFMLLFTAGTACLGYFTALLVKTKNRSADVAAGLAVGTMAGIGIFLTCFGTLTIVTTSDTPDEDLLAVLARTPIEDGTPQLVSDTYPELEHLSRSEQVGLLSRKMQSDQLYNVSRGILMGSICCLVVFIFAGVAETVIAGPIVRKYDFWFRSWGVYMFRSYPFVVFTIAFGIHIAAYFALGDSGILWRPLVWCTLAVVCIAMWAEIRKWNYWVRVAISVGTFNVFLAFFLYSFPLIPVISSGRISIERRSNVAEKHPDNDRSKLLTAEAYLYFGQRLARFGYYDEAIVQFEKTYQYLDEHPTTDNGLFRDQLIASTVNDHAETIRLQNDGNPDGAAALFFEARQRYPSNIYVWINGVRSFASASETGIADRLIDSARITDAESWVLTRQVVSQALLNRSAGEDDVGNVERRLELIIDNNDLDEVLSSRLKRTSRRQHWLLTGPVDEQDVAALQGELISLDSQASLKNRAAAEGWLQHEILDYWGTSLDLLFADAPEQTSGFAVACIRSDKEFEANFFFGSDDGAEIWINGEKVLSEPAARKLTAREDEFTYRLPAGESLIVVRVDQVGAHWAFELEIEGADQWPADIRWITND